MTEFILAVRIRRIVLINPDRKYLFLSALIFACLLPFHAGAQMDGEVVIVKADGTAAVEGNDRASARKEAVEKALRNAMGQAIETLCQSDSAEQRQNYREGVHFQKARDYIQEYRILEEYAADDLYHVNISATFLSSKIREALAQSCSEKIQISTEDENGLDPEFQSEIRAARIFLAVRGIDSCSDYVLVKNILKSRRELISGLYEQIIESGLVRFEVELMGDITAFARELALLSLVGVRIAISNITADEITIELLRQTR